MEDSDVVELIEKSRSDGAQLYSVADSLHKLAIFLIGVFAILGVILAFGVMINVGFLAGLAAFIFVGFVCFVLYAADILATNGLKVLVHILFSNLALMQKGLK